MTPDNGNYSKFLFMGNAGLISPTVVAVGNSPETHAMLSGLHDQIAPLPNAGSPPRVMLSLDSAVELQQNALCPLLRRLLRHKSLNPETKR